ncbi:MAG TPA: HEPN domain-containing protein [Streptosporangiaceae bacterium]|nr:HEPN domain-containing protein [Streptosporangiaceae bacterium]
MRWGAGEADIDQLLAQRHLERVQGAQADGRSWLDKARQTLDAARLIAQAAPDSSIILAYDAARQACVALLAQQGLRPTTAGGHKAVDDAVRAQFGAGLRAFGGLRRRRNELEYPDYPTEKASGDEAAEALETASEIIDAASQLLPNLGFF